MARLNILVNRSTAVPPMAQDRLPLPPRQTRTFPRRLTIVALAAVTLVAGLELMGWLLATREPPPEEPDAKRLRAMKTENSRLRQKLASLAPQGLYVVVDTAGNRVYVRRGDKTLKEMIASCGSGNVLEDPAGGRTWTFDTPRGEFRIQSKIDNPVWIKPDWAFIEEGEPIPGRRQDRAEPGMMGDYALGIGQGYFIHGTMYSRLLGRNVSHGCVRLGDDDLEALVKSVSLGTRVIIF